MGIQRELVFTDVTEKKLNEKIRMKEFAKDWFIVNNIEDAFHDYIQGLLDDPKTSTIIICPDYKDFIKSIDPNVTELDVTYITSHIKEHIEHTYDAYDVNHIIYFKNDGASKCIQELVGFELHSKQLVDGKRRNNVQLKLSEIINALKNYIVPLERESYLINYVKYYIKHLYNPYSIEYSERKLTIIFEKPNHICNLI